MKTKFFKTNLLALFIIVSASCSKDDDSNSINSGGGGTSTPTTNTWVKLSAVTTGSVAKPNYIIMMFDEPATSTSPLPPIKKQVITDANGVAFFDLNSMLTSTTAKTYYFEAFVQDGSTYVWKSISHYQASLKKGSMVTSSIIVN